MLKEKPAPLLLCSQKLLCRLIWGYPDHLSWIHAFCCHYFVFFVWCSKTATVWNSYVRLVFICVSSLILLNGFRWNLVLQIYTGSYYEVKLSLCMINEALCHEDTQEIGGIVPLFLTSAINGGEWSALCPGHFTPGERCPSACCTGGWLGPRAYIYTVELTTISCFCQESEPQLSSP
jgi:hypothetical protein